MFRGILTVLLITGFKGSGGSKKEWENTMPTLNYNVVFSLESLMVSELVFL